MLKRLFTKTNSEELTQESDQGNFVPRREYYVVQAGQEIIQDAKYAHQVRRVKRLISATDVVWQKHYLHTIERFAELVQGAPASESHHHSHHGGLIEHTLDVLATGVQVAQGFMLPPNVEPEKLLESVDRWRFGVFVAIIAHDLGKVATDIEFVYRQRGGEFEKWHPWLGPMPVNAEYVYRYKPRLTNNAVGKSLHERASISIVPQLLTKEATLWIYSDVELVGQLLNTITSSTAGGGVIAEIVRQADKASVASSMGAHQIGERSHSAALTLHEKSLNALRQLIDDGDLKRNRPGAAVWSTETHTWVVSRVGVEAIKAKLISEGHKGIPNNPVRMFEHFQAQGITISPENGDNTWRAEVNDFSRGWVQILTFMCFANETIWPTRMPEIFDGSITPVDENDKPIGLLPTTAEQVPMQEVAKSREVQPRPVPTEKPSVVESTIAPESSPPKTPVKKPAAAATPKPSVKNVQTPPESKSAKSFSTQRQGLKPEKTVVERTSTYTDTGKPNISEKELREHPFFHWLLEGIAHRSIKVNEPKAMVHIVDGFVALVTPSVFHRFFESAIQKKRYELKGEGKPLFTVIQKELFGLGVSHIGANGRNIIDLTVTGVRKKTAMSAILIGREYLPSLDKFSPNSAVKITEQ
tara:strand:- start:8298 stop:10220 length:1923 start_codon:yes stop_codon:yes gene_type:complete